MSLPQPLRAGLALLPSIGRPLRQSRSDPHRPRPPPPPQCSPSPLLRTAPVLTDRTPLQGSGPAAHPPVGPRTPGHHRAGTGRPHGARTGPTPQDRARLAGPGHGPPMGRRKGGRAARWEARLRARGACREMQSNGNPTGERTSSRGHRRRPAGGIHQQITIINVVVVVRKCSALNTHSATCCLSTNQTLQTAGISAARRPGHHGGPGRGSLQRNPLQGRFLRQEKGAGYAVCSKLYSTGIFHEARVHWGLEHPEMLGERRESKTQP